MRVIVFNGYWTRDDVKQNPDWLFLFGDNNIGKGRGGQAIIRGIKNTAGIPTKKYPNNWITSFYSDDEYEDNCKNINNAIKKIKKRFIDEKYEKLVLPENGFGTGLSKLPTKAPKTYKHLVKQVKKLVKEIKKTS